MTRTVYVVLVGLALVGLLYGATHVRSASPQTFALLPESEFSPLPFQPLERPGRPTDAPGRTIAPVVAPTAKPTPRPPRTVVPVGPRISGVATYYAYHQGQAAAARALRAFLGPTWRGTVVRVAGPLGHLNVRLTDFESSGIPNRLIDLDSRDWAAICGDLSIGVCRVEVSR